MYKEFKNFVDDVSSPIESFYKDRDLVFKYFETGANTISDITDFLYKKIKEEIEVTDKEKSFRKLELFKIEEDFINRYILFNENPVKYLKILRIINDSCRTENTRFLKLENVDKWKNAISYAKSFDLISPLFDLSINNIRKEYPEYTDRANSIKYITRNGASLVYDDNNITIDKTEIFFQSLDKRIKKVGGLNIAKFLFEYLGKSYSKEFERFLITRQTNTFPEKVNPQIPFGYLFNMCVKYPYSSRKTIPQKEILDIINKAIIGCNAVYSIQHYSLWSYLLNRGDSIIETIRDVAMWDSIFSIHQVRAKNIIELCHFIFDGFPEEKFKEIFHFSFDNFMQVVNYLFKNNPGSQLHFFDRKQMDNEFRGIAVKELSLILELLSFNNSANAEYLLPNDIASVDFLFKPLIKIENNKYLLFFSSWNATAIFEVLVNKARVHYKPYEFDSMIGTKLEEFLYAVLAAHNISFSSGKYNVEGIEGEADLVIETGEKIILLEIKKKVLTRKAKSGIDTDLLVDLSKTIIDVSLQSGRTEILLRKYGELTLTDKKGNVKQINHNDRNFEHIGVTQMEFGGFHNKEIMNSFFTSLLTHSFHLVSDKNPILNKEFTELNSKQVEWVKQYNELYHLSENYQHNPYFDNWFISYNQLLEMISLSNSNETFYENITMPKHINFGTFDFYNEYLHAIKLKNNPSSIASKFSELSSKKRAVYVPFNG